MGYTQVVKKLNEYALNPIISTKDGKLFITDNGNYIVDLQIGKPMDIMYVYNKVRSITGVLFINMCK